MAKKPMPPSHAVPVLKKRKARTPSPTEFVLFLRETLIPDLREAGTEYTADDFDTAADMISALAAVVDALWPDGDADAEWTTDTIENVARACEAYRPKGGR